MRCSAVGRTNPDSVLWPAACPACGAVDLAYQHEDGCGDLCRCRICGAVIQITESLCEAGRWRRCLRILPARAHPQPKGD